MQGMPDADFSLDFKKFFTPLTNVKVVIWITIIGFIVYGNMLFNGFVWDDFTFIITTPDIHTFNILHLFQNNIFNHGGYYRPIPAVYFSMLYNFFGSNAFFYHFFQLTLHIIDTCLLFFFFRKFFATSLSFFLSLLFLIHPIQVESVSYIGASQSELLFFFGMNALLLSMQKKTNLSHMLLTFVLLLLALLTKESSFLFLLMIFSYQYLFNKKKVFVYNPYLIIVIISYFIIRIFLGNVPFESNITTAISHLSLGGRLLNIPLLFFYYVKTFFYPAALSIDQRWVVTSLDGADFYLPLLADIVFTGLLSYFGYFCFKKNKGIFNLYLFFAVWFFVSMGMLMQLIPLDMTVAERWFYLPMVGLLGMFGVGLSLLPTHWKTNKNVWYSFLFIMLIFLSIRTMVRNTNWINEITLFSHDIRISDNWQLENMLGVAYFRENLNNQAIIYYRKSLAMNPIDSTYYNVAQVYGKTGKLKIAEKYYLLAIHTFTYEPDDTVLHSAYNQLVTMTAFYDDPHLAKQYAQEGLRYFSSDGILWADLALCNYKMHDYQNALAAIKKANYYLPNDSNVQSLYLQIQSSLSAKK